MEKNDKFVVILGVIIVIVASIGIYLGAPDSAKSEEVEIEEFYSVTGEFSQLPTAITVSDEDPFYALIATPIAIHYSDTGEQSVLPLYVKDYNDPSRAIERAEEMIGLYTDLSIGCPSTESITNTSLDLARTYWEKSDSVLIIEPTQEGYNLGVPAVPMASYLRIPVIVTDEINQDVQDLFSSLGVKQILLCGNMSVHGMTTLTFKDTQQVLNATMDMVKEKFGDINYMTLTNPLDIVEPEVLNSTSEHFEGTVASTSFTFTNILNMAVSGLKGISTIASHEFEIPETYDYARVKLYAKNLVDEDIEKTGSRLLPMLSNSDGDWLALAFTVGGIPERDSSGAIVQDQVEWETTIHDDPGPYTIDVAGQFLASKTGDYEIDLVIEELNNSLFPNMPGLSSIAPYLTACRKGVIFANPDFIFVGDEAIIDNPPSGVVYPASNPDLIESSNEHTFEIHESINEVLAQIRQINLSKETGLEALRNSYNKNPIYIALVGDARMLPQYYYYDTEDAVSLQYGWDVASDFIYGNIDPVPRDDKISIYQKDQFISDFDDEKYPHQENIIGRITGWDVQDASALVVRTIFYDHVIDDLDDWKDNALVQTGSGTDFQRIPFVDLFRKIIGAHDLPFKWPTGEAHFENLIVVDSMDDGGFTVTSTENLKSMREGLSDEVLSDINRLGITNLIFFPKVRVKALMGEDKISGGEDQMNSNFIFTFGHGQPMGYSHGDVQTASMGFRPVLLDNLINRFMFGTFLPSLTSGLGNVGGYSVRAVENMDMGPSVVFVESCYIGRIDGFPAKCLTSQAYLHAGVNTFIASSRGTPGPGYLDARTRAKGFGIIEWIRTTMNPSLQQPHFSALHAVNIYSDLIKNDVDVGTAFRNAKNKFMEDADSEFFWTPPLSLQINTDADLDMVLNGITSTSGSGGLCMEKKYTCLYEYNLFGDPAFNPYEPINNG